MANPEYDTWLSVGGYIHTSGTTGPKKSILQSPEKITASNIAAIMAQKLGTESRVLTIGKLKHAGGIFAQTLPAYTIGASIKVDNFNPLFFTQIIKSYTHTHLTPIQAKDVMDTDINVDYKGIWITCGSDRVHWNVIEHFVERGATFMANWGMTEVGPIAINSVFTSLDQVLEAKEKCPKDYTLLGNTFYCDYKILNEELIVKGNISVYGDNWFATGDLVKEVDGNLYFKGRK